MSMSAYYLEDGRGHLARLHVVAAVVHTRPRPIPLAMITSRKPIRGFPSLSYMVRGMGLRLELRYYHY